MNSRLDKAIEQLITTVKARYPEAEVEPIQRKTARYDAEVVFRLPSDWLLKQVMEFKGWVEDLTYQLFMEQKANILVEAYNLTRNQQELVKWIRREFPDLDEEDLPASKIKYRREAAEELLDEHYGRVDERLIEMSPRTREDWETLRRKKHDTAQH